jgi:hypothetical protein
VFEIDVGDWMNFLIRKYFVCGKSPIMAYATSLLRFIDYIQLDTQTHTHTHKQIHTQIHKHTYTQTHIHTNTYTCKDFSGRVISLSQRPLLAPYITNTKDELPCPYRDSNPQYQQSKGRQRKPQTVQLPGSTNTVKNRHKLNGLRSKVKLKIIFFPGPKINFLCAEL